MTSPFPTPYQEHYVYKHMCPVTKDLLYVGHGSGSRAWMYSTPFRSEDHAEYMTMLVSQGYLPSDWVIITHRNIGKNFACGIEQELIKQGNPTFNKPSGIPFKISPPMLELAMQLRESGMSYEAIAKELEASTMTVFRAIKRSMNE